MAATPQWRIATYQGKIFQSEIDPTPVMVISVDDPNFCLVTDPDGNRRNIPWVQMDNGFYQPVPSET